ncbi:DUF1382 family protein [Pseudomonas fulva]|nr:DUF1382 family protein [Pseudomonas fulva]MBF8780986.1 DUF1382 family protein [Pseudomonas fulva]
MNRASPVQLRQALQMANTFVSHGIRFVCVPVTDEADHASLLAQVDECLERLAAQAEAEECK